MSPVAFSLLPATIDWWAKCKVLLRNSSCQENVTRWTNPGTEISQKCNSIRIKSMFYTKQLAASLHAYAVRIYSSEQPFLFEMQTSNLESYPTRHSGYTWAVNSAWMSPILLNPRRKGIWTHGSETWVSTFATHRVDLLLRSWSNVVTHRHDCMLHVYLCNIQCRT